MWNIYMWNFLFCSHTAFVAFCAFENSGAIHTLVLLPLVFGSPLNPPSQILVWSSHYFRYSDTLDEISWDGIFFLQCSEFLVGTINLENHNSLFWMIFLCYHSDHLYLFFSLCYSFCKFYNYNTDIMLLELILQDMFHSSSSYILFWNLGSFLIFILQPCY